MTWKKNKKKKMIAMMINNFLYHFFIKIEKYLFKNICLYY